MAVLLINLACAWFMGGVIWVVQVVHYAQFDGVGADGWQSYHQRHGRGITRVVAPAMLVEAATSAWLVARPPPGMPAWAAWVGLAMVVALWASTALVQVPLHRRLEATFDARAGRQLVATNWARTILWTARGGLMLWAVWQVAHPA